MTTEDLPREGLEVYPPARVGFQELPEASFVLANGLEPSGGVGERAAPGGAQADVDVVGVTHSEVD